jgi:DNA-binding Lrp family transcriptional regulator
METLIRLNTGWKLLKKEVIQMAPKAFILIETAVGKAKEVATALEQINGLKSVDMVTGPYDIITTIEAETLNNIGDMVTGKIHAIDGISRTVTCLVV